MVESILTMPTTTLLSSGIIMKKKKKKKMRQQQMMRSLPIPSWDIHTNNIMMKNANNNDEKPAGAAFRLFSPPAAVSVSYYSSIYCRRRSSRLAAAAVDSTAGDGNTVDEEEQSRGVHHHPLPGGLRPELMPKHVALIMDGHGRWAHQRGLPTREGHLAGRDSFKKLVLAASSKFRLKALTVYAFSTENWTRSQAEIDFLMNGYEDVIRSFVMELILRQELRFSVVGDKSRLPASLQSAIFQAEESSKGNKGMHLVMAMSYSGRLDITEATKKIASKVEDGSLRAKDINEDTIQQHLMTSSIQLLDPDLLIRTSGELRMSNFLMWQLAYSEFYFISKMFPDLDEPDLVEALTCFQGRKRRYGRREISH